MAITDISAFAHLTSEDVENLAVELDGLRREIEESRGARDARYIRRTNAAQRALELGGRVLLAASTKRAAWWSERSHWPSPRSLRIWRSGTTSCTVSGTG